MDERETEAETALGADGFIDELSDEALDRTEARLCPGTVSASQ